MTETREQLLAILAAERHAPPPAPYTNPRRDYDTEIDAARHPEDPAVVAARQEQARLAAEAAEDGERD